MKQMAILTDVTLCIGCSKCVDACKQTNETGQDKPWLWQERIDDLSASRWTTIIRAARNTNVRRQCRHCLEPACASACPVGAMKKTAEGAVTYDSSICLGCRYCMMACPYGIPRFLWSQPIALVRKCILCHDKIKAGQLDQPACTAICPTKATIFGEREQLLKVAQKRINDNPNRYINHIWGKDEIGGTSVMYISNIDLSFLSMGKNLGTKPLPERTWGALTKVPFEFFGMGIIMTGIYWIIERRRKLAKMNNQPVENNTKTEVDNQED